MLPLCRIIFALAVLAAAPVAAQPAGEDSVKIELNKLEPAGSACRAYLVFQNATAYSFDSFKLDLVMFDTDGVIAKRLAVEAGALPSGKTSVKLFDIDGQSCDALERVLLNSVMACGTASGDTPDCTALTETSSRAKADFLK